MNTLGQRLTRALAAGAAAFLAALLVGVAAPAPAAAQGAAASLQDLVGARGAGGEAELARRGFASTGARTSGDARLAYWWSRQARQCVAVTTADGRYEAIRDATPEDCNEKVGMTSGQKVAVGAAAVGVAAIGAAILANQARVAKHRRMDRQQRADYDRGYDDGRRGARFDDGARSDAYADGYRDGADDARSASRGRYDTPHDRYDASRDRPYGTPYGGRDAGAWRYLRGRAQAEASRDLSDRGFRQVDVSLSGGTVYSVWYNRYDRQCVQLTTFDRRVDDARDIGSHPRCR